MSLATLAGHRVERLSVLIPRTGIPTAEVVITTLAPISGTVDLVLGSLVLSMTVTSGGPDHARGHYTLVGGAGGWRTSIASQAYDNALEVKLSTVLRDASKACGETMGAIVERRIGPGFLRPEGDASTCLTLLCLSGWYVDEAGTTRVGVRPRAPVLSTGRPFVVIEDRPAEQTKIVRASEEDLSLILPGLQVSEGWEVSSVRHDLTPESLRTTLVRHHTSALATVGEAFSRLYGLLSRETKFHRLAEYTVTGVISDAYLDLSPRRAASRMPSLANVPMMGGLGLFGAPAIGSTVLVGFGDGEPTRPYVVAYEGGSGQARTPTGLTLDASGTLDIGSSAASIEMTGTTVPLSHVGHFVRYGDVLTGPAMVGAPYTLTPQVPGVTPISKVRG